LLAALVAIGCSHTAQRVPLLDGPEAAAYYDAAKRGITPGMDVAARYETARQSMTRMKHVSADGTPQPGRIAAEALTTSQNWTFLGPGNVGGRTRALVIDPTNPDILYAGAAGGGVWKSYNGGGAWIAAGDRLANLAVSALALDPADPRTVYAGTGEGNLREQLRGVALGIYGDGIYVSHDGASSWTALAATRDPDFRFVNDVVVSAQDSRRLYAATSTGVWRSRDGGATWTRALATTVNGGCLHLRARPGSDGDFLFASCGSLEQATIYRNPAAEGDGEWQAVLTEPGMGLTALAVAPSRPSTIYALASSIVDGPGGNYLYGLHAVFRSDHDGEAGSWTALVRNSDTADRLSTLLLTNPSPATSSDCNSGGSNAYFNQGWWDNAIAVDPADPERVFAAGVDLFRSDDGGRIWRPASYWWTDESDPRYVHADLHNIVFDPRYDGASNQTLYVTGDGGVARTANARAEIGRNGANSPCDTNNSSMVFSMLNHNYGATLFYQGVALPDGSGYLGGTQDNSTPFGKAVNGIDGWSILFGGDGGFVAVDPIDPQVIYGESQYGALFRSTNGGATFRGIRNGISDSMLFVAPFILDRNARTRLWAGGTRIWRSETRGDGWAAASNGPFDAGSISALAVAPGKSDRVLAGTTLGNIARTESATSANASTQWDSVKPRNGWVSSLTFDPDNASTVYATYAGFGGGAHVWRSTDAGATWSPLDGSGDGALPDIPFHSLAIWNGRLFLGSDLGIFVSTDGGAHWAVDTNFPAVKTESISIGQGQRGPALYAFTHGRGAWRTELTAGGRRRLAGR
jgi:hypothetical protein